MSKCFSSLVKITLPLALSLASSNALPCSTIAVEQWDSQGNLVNVINARNMDFPEQIFFAFGFGSTNTSNISDVDFYPGLSDEQVASWSNTHNFVGRLALNSEVLVDGINDAGLYAGFLYLPDVTQYPSYDSSDKRPALSVMDTLNFVLGTADSVQDAITRLQGVQLVNSASETEIARYAIFVNEPLHLVIRDKYGDAAVIEYIKGKVNIFTQDVDTVTNSPDYSWQLQHFMKETKNFKNHNTRFKLKGVYINGSGLKGLPGSGMSQDRFVLGKQILKFSPVAHTQDQAVTLAEGVIDKLKSAFGTDSSPTLWTSMSDLANNIYYFKGFVAFSFSTPKGGIVVLEPGAGQPRQYVTINLNELNADALPPGYVAVQTTRNIKYVDPSSPTVHYGQGSQPGTTYNVEFLTPDQFTEQLDEGRLFKGNCFSESCIR